MNMKKKMLVVLWFCLNFLALVSLISANFGKLPAGSTSKSKMGKTSEIVLYLVFDPSLIREEIPNNIRVLSLEEMATKGDEFDKYLKLHPEHKKWAWSFFEIIGTESLSANDQIAKFTTKGGLAVWYVSCEQRDPKDPRALGYQMLAMGTWLSDQSLAAYCKSNGWPWEKGEIKYWEDDSGLINGLLKTADFEIMGICKRQKPIKMQAKYPAYQTYWSPLPYARSFEVVTFYGHKAESCSAQWTFKGNHPLIKAYHSRAEGSVLISGTEYSWDYVLKGALYFY